MAKQVRRTKSTGEQRVASRRKHVRKLTYMMRCISEMIREGSFCETDLLDIAHKLRVIREINRTKIVMQLEQSLRETEKKRNRAS